MALKICTYNCKGFNISKVKHFKHLLSECDILLVQETWALKDQVGRLNRHFDDYNTYGVSGITEDVLLKGRPYGGVSFLYKKSMSPYVQVCELSSNRACCIRLSTNVGYVYVFNVYMSCDSTTNTNLADYNEVLSVISNFCATHNVVNCVIGGDVNIDILRIKSGNTIRLQNFIEKENLFLAINEVINTVTYTYTGMNNTSSLIDHFIMSENMCLLANNYYTMDSVDNLSDHVPLFIVVNCFVETVPIESVKGECSVFLKNNLLWMKTMHYPNIIRSHLVTIVPVAPFAPKSTSKLRSALHIRYSKVIPRFISRANTAQT